MPANRSDRPDFADRRRRIGASREVMAIGLGLTAAEIQEIEESRAPEAMLNHYSQWLDRLEAWPAESAQMLLAVIDGAKRFEAAATARKGARLTDACPDRWRPGQAADSDRPGLVASLSPDDRGAWLPEGEVGLHRR
jgi:hypothetical protein